MNTYDTKTVSCTMCGKQIGEVEFDAKIYSLCGKCSDPFPQYYEPSQKIIQE